MQSSVIPEMHALVVDDEPGVRRFVAEVLRGDGWAVSEAETAERAFEKLHEQRWSLVICDVLLGGEDGYAVLRRFTEEQPQARVILMTGQGSAAGALDATASGAHDYLLKPFGDEQVRALSSAVRQRIAERARARTNGASTPSCAPNAALIGRSPTFVEVMKLVGRVASTNLPILITGESGTGKEVVARTIHRRSRRAGHAFVAVNCGALPSELIESELFGHTRGSFTGAERDRQGLFEEARGGTVLLDEITETTPAFQVKLLRALQEGEVRRVGSNITTHVDVRVIAATNRNLPAEVKEGRFRQDLLYRLNTLSIHLPPLRERREDILPLVLHFAERARRQNDHPLNFPPDTLRLLENYDWPGNIRELENVVIRAAALCDDTVPPEALPENICRSDDAALTGAEEQIAAVFAMKGKQWPTLSEIESRYVARVLAHTGGNKLSAARLLGVDRNTLKRMIDRHDLTT
jgi:two-component system, NtrC family, response regulator AtoC